MGTLRRASQLTNEARPATRSSDEIVRRPPSERRVLLAVIAVTTAGVMPVFLFGGLAVQVSGELDLTAAAKGQIVFGYFGISALASAWSGRLTERFGPPLLMRLAAVCGASSSVAVAAAQSFVWIGAAVALGGLANALAQPAANALVVHHIDAGRRGFALGVKQSAIPVATLVAGLAVPTVGLTVGWRWAFIGASVLAVTAALAVPATTSTTVARAATRVPPDRLRPLIVLAFGACLGSGVANVLGAFTTSSAVDAGISPGAAGGLLAGASALGLGLRLASGWLADSRDGGHVTTVAFMLAGGGIGVVGMASDQVPILVLGTLLAFGSGWSWPGVFNLAVVSYYPRTPAAATGITQTGTYTGGAIGPLVMGTLVERYGYDRAWIVFAVVAVTGALIVLRASRILTTEP